MIEYAILGLLSRTPLTGYDLKKLFSESETLYWSGNNNQIYRALVKLHSDGLVTKETYDQPSGPSRKVYTITEQGLAELKRWVLSAPELPQVRNPFLIRLMWSDQLNPAELDTLLANYEDELHVKLLMLREQQQRGNTFPARTPRESYLWDKITENWLIFYENELNWVRQLRQELGDT